MKKKMSIIMACIMCLLTVATSVSAAEISNDAVATNVSESVTASNYFTGSTGTMNSLYGAESTRWPISSPTMSTGNPAVTKVTVTVTKNCDRRE